MTSRLFETASYYIQVGPSRFETSAKGHSCYQLYNKLTNVLEGESLSLPDSIAALLGREQYLQEALEAYNTGSILLPDQGGEVH